MVSAALPPSRSSIRTVWVSVAMTATIEPADENEPTSGGLNLAPLHHELHTTALRKRGWVFIRALALP